MHVRANLLAEAARITFFPVDGEPINNTFLQHARTHKRTRTYIHTYIHTLRCSLSSGVFPNFIVLLLHATIDYRCSHSRSIHQLWCVLRSCARHVCVCVLLFVTVLVAMSFFMCSSPLLH